MSTTCIPVWILENDVAVRYLGVPFTYKNEQFYCIFSSHAPNLVKRVDARDVYRDATSAVKSIPSVECWYIDDGKIVSTIGYRKNDGSLAAFDKISNGRIWGHEIFTTHVKAQNWLRLARRNEKRTKLR